MKLEMRRNRCDDHGPFPGDVPAQGIEKELVQSLLSSLARPDAIIEEVVAGRRFIAVTAGGRTGISSLLGSRPTEEELSLIGNAVGQKARRVADYLLLPAPFSVCLGMAALNAANSPDPAAVSEQNASAADLIAGIGRDKVVGLVGDFPFTDDLREKVGALHLFELRETRDSLPAERWDSVLPGLDVLAVTGTAILTRQMAYFLGRAERARSVVIGPTTPLASAMFGFGADHLCGSIITDPRRVTDGIRSGLSFQAMKKNGGIRFVRMDRGD